MLKDTNHKTFRVIDANLNRAKEGLRVCEEIFRFILPDKYISGQLKEIRHKISSIPNSLSINKSRLFAARDTDSDIGKPSSILELKRNGIEDVFFANIQRAKESIRVLEEFSKLINPKKIAKIKALRYEVYRTEKKAAKKIQALCNSR